MPLQPARDEILIPEQLVPVCQMYTRHIKDKILPAISAAKTKDEFNEALIDYVDAGTKFWDCMLDHFPEIKGYGYGIAVNDDNPNWFALHKQGVMGDIRTKLSEGIVHKALKEPSTADAMLKNFKRLYGRR